MPEAAPTAALYLSPRQRWALYNHSRSRTRTIKGKEAGQAGRRERRFFRALGLDLIYDVMVANEDEVASDRPRNTTPSRFVVTDEVLDHIQTLESVERHPSMDLDLGPVFDQVADLKAGREAPEHDCADFEPDRDSWVPSDEDDAAYLVRALGARVQDRDIVRKILQQALELVDAPA